MLAKLVGIRGPWLAFETPNGEQFGITSDKFPEGQTPVVGETYDIQREQSKLSMPMRELCDIIVAMAEGRRIICPGATQDPDTNTYGVPVSISAHVVEQSKHNGVIVTLDTGVETYLSPRWIKG